MPAPFLCAALRAEDPVKASLFLKKRKVALTFKMKKIIVTIGSIGKSRKGGAAWDRSVFGNGY